MATRLKTVEFNVPVDTTTLAAATARDKTVTVYLPETVVAFKSCVLIASYRGDNAAGASSTSSTLRLGIGANAIVTLAMNTAPPAGTGEHEGWVVAADFVAEFTTNWSGTSQSVTVGVNVGGVATTNHDFKLCITYEYDDTATTHIKTVRIPIESTRALLTTAMQTIGGATVIPALTGGYLPENNVVIRNAVVELWGFESNVSTTDFEMFVRFDGGAEVSAYRAESALNSSPWASTKLDISGLDTSVARSLEARATVTSRMNQLGGLVTVTYEFNASTSTTIFNSVMLGGADTAGNFGGTVAADRDAWGRDIWVEEPGTITMKESAVCMFLTDSVAMSVIMGVGDQAERTYSFTAGTLNTGQYSVVHRFDAAGQVGTAGMTLARGRNSYLLKFRPSTAHAAWNLSGFLVLNYTSGKATAGVGVHNHSVREHFERNSYLQTNITTNSIPALDPPEANWFLVSALLHIFGNMASGPTGAQSAFLERGVGEGEGDGWEPIYTGMYRADSENQVMTMWGAARSAWKRWPGDPDPDRYDPTVARRYRVDALPQGFLGWGIWCTYHSITFTVAGTISGYTGDGSGIEVGVYRAATGEKVLELTTAVGGTFTTQWYDNTEELFVEAMQDATHLGRSANSLAA